MHIVAIAWLYVIVLVAMTEPNAIAGALTLLFLGILPLALLLWIAARWHRLSGTPRPSRRDDAAKTVAAPSRKDTQAT